jgi:hypothetical protein
MGRPDPLCLPKIISGRNGPSASLAFKRLAVGTHVTFVEEMGEKGPQASTVRLLRKHSMRI